MIAPAFVHVVAALAGVVTLAALALFVHLGVAGLGLSVLVIWASVTVARWLKVRPTPRSAPEHVGLGRLSGTLVLAWMLANTALRSLQPQDAQLAQLDVLFALVIAFGAGFITLVLRRPKRSWRRTLSKLRSSVSAALARPVMGGTGN